MMPSQDGYAPRNFMLSPAGRVGPPRLQPARTPWSSALLAPGGGRRCLLQLVLLRVSLGMHLEGRCAPLRPKLREMLRGRRPPGPRAALPRALGLPRHLFTPDGNSCDLFAGTVSTLLVKRLFGLSLRAPVGKSCAR